MKFSKFWGAFAAVSLLAASAFFVSCGGDNDSESESSHDHTFATEWTNDATYHWHAATCKHKDEVKDKAEHTWNDGVVTKEPTTDEEGVKTFTCDICKHTKTAVIEKLSALNAYDQPIDAETELVASRASTYIYFGVFPKTVLPKANENIIGTETVKMGKNIYYKGSDGNFYARVIENAAAEVFNSEYTDGTQVQKSTKDSFRYFKVEPIKWKVLTTNYNDTGKALLLAEDILTANVNYFWGISKSKIREVGSDTSIYHSNYKYSEIRAYLNGLDYYEYNSFAGETVAKDVHKEKGFLQTAFTSKAQELIVATEVDNSADSTTDTGNNLTKATSYACANTTDKIFLLSEKEVTTSDYGFAAYDICENARIRKPTDYAKANSADSSGYWWLRSPCADDEARKVNYDGSANRYDYVYEDDNGIVPALCISLQ